MKFVDPTQPYRKFGSWLFLKKSRTSRRLPVQSRSENALGEGGEHREVRFNIAPHHGAISYFNPGMSLKLVRLARDAIEEFARDVAAAKHEVRGQALRETHKGERGVTHHSLD